MKICVQLFCLLWAVAVMQACSDSSSSVEDEIRQFVKAGVVAAEDRSADDLAGMMHDNYLDQQGYNKKQLGGLLQAYFFRHKSIHLFTRIDEIELLTENQVIVRLHVAMAGTAISDVNALASLRAQVYSFELQLVKQGDWLLRHAIWGPADMSDFR